MQIIRVPDLGSTPARVHRPSGTVYINGKVWDKLPPGIQKIILLHEQGHHVLNTSNELEADAYAFSNYALTEPYSLKNLLSAVTTHLNPGQNPEHKKRAKAQLIRVLRTDANNGNLQAKKLLFEMENTNTYQISNELRQQFPGATDEEISLAMFYAASVKNEFSGYADREADDDEPTDEDKEKKRLGLKLFAAKAGDKLGEMLQNPKLQKMALAAGASIGVPPQAITAGLTALGNKVEKFSENQAGKISAKLGQEYTPGNKPEPKQEPKQQPVVNMGAGAPDQNRQGQKFAETNFGAEAASAEPPKSNMAMYLGIAAVAAVVLYLVYKNN